MIDTMAVYGALPGACGGVALFLYGYKTGHFKNNKYKIKFTVEVIGAATTAGFLAVIFPHDYRIVAAFLIGISWSAIIQMARNKISKIVCAALGENLES
jgi:hypothetical protein